MKLLSQLIFILTFTFVILPLAIAQDRFESKKCEPKSVSTFKAGKIAFQQGDFETAIICWEKTIKQFSTSPSQNSIQYSELLRDLDIAYFEAGKINFQKGNIETAIIYWEKNLKQFPTSPWLNSIKYIDLLRRLATAYQSLGYSYKARNTLYCALFYAQSSTQDEMRFNFQIQEEKEDYRMPLVRIFAQMSEVYQQMGDFLEEKDEKTQDLITTICRSPIQLTQETYQKELKKKLESEIKKIEKGILINNLDKAEYYLEMAEKIAPENSWLRASVSNQQGNLLMTEQEEYIGAFSVYRKDYEGALLKYKEAKKMGEKNKKLMVEISLNIAQLYAEVLSIYQNIRKQKADIWNDENFLSALDDCINVISENCKNTESFYHKKQYDNSINLAQIIGEIEDKVDALLILEKFNNQVDNQAWMIKTLKELLPHSSVEQYLENLDNLIKTSVKLKELKEHILSQRKLGIDKEIEQALEIALQNSLNQILENLNKLPASYGKSFDLMSVAYLAENLPVKKASSCSQPDWTTQERKFRFKPLKQALKLFEVQAEEQQYDPITQSYAKGYLAKLYADKQCYVQAIQITKEAIKLLPNKTDKRYIFKSRPDLLFRWYKQLGDFLLEQNPQQQPFLKDLQQIQQPIEKEKENFCQIDNRKLEKPWFAYKCANEFLQQVHQHYRCGLKPLISSVEQFRAKQIGLFLQWYSSTEEQNKPIFLKQVREHLELFKIAELRNYFQDDCITEPVSTDDLDRVFNDHPQTAILYTFLDKENDKVQLLLNSKNHLELSTLENVNELTNQVNHIREEMKRVEFILEEFAKGKEAKKDGEVVKFRRGRMYKLKDELSPSNVTIEKLMFLFNLYQKEMKKEEVLDKKVVNKKITHFVREYFAKDFTPENTRKLQEFYARLDQEIRDLHTNLYVKNWRSRQLIPYLKSLYKDIFGSFNPPETKRETNSKTQQLFSNTQNLIIVADGILRTLPFAALHDGKNFLIEKVALVIEPAVKLVNIGKPIIQLEQRPALLSAIPEFKDHLEPISCALLGKTTHCVDEENVELLKGEAFTINNVEKEFHKSYAILHFSTHGKFESNPNDTHLQAHAPKKIKIKQFRKLLEKIPKPVELLTFSACETVLGNERAALGLTGVAVQTGVHSAIGTLWQVRADSTKKLITDFYQTWRNHKKEAFSDKAEALQQVQIKFLKTENTERDFSHPYFWAPFVLVGNWL